MPRGRARRAAHRAGGCRTRTARDGQGSCGPRGQRGWTRRWSQRHRVSLGMCLLLARRGVPRKSARSPALLPPAPELAPGARPRSDHNPAPPGPPRCPAHSSCPLPRPCPGRRGTPRETQSGEERGSTDRRGLQKRGHPRATYRPQAALGQLERSQPGTVRVRGSGRIWGILNGPRGSGCGQTPAFPPGQPLKGTHAPFSPKSGSQRDELLPTWLQL